MLSTYTKPPIKQLIACVHNQNCDNMRYFPLALNTYINRTVVLVDLNAQVVSNGREVVWLRHVAQAMVLGNGGA